MVGLLAGIYPSIAISSFQPAEVLKRNHSGYGTRGRLRKVLVVLQFAVTIIILACTVTACLT